MGHEVVPIAQLNRLAEHGRIRTGVKTAKAMKSIDTFRFTSPDRTALQQVADEYGGTVQPWSDPKASPRQQFELLTTAAEINVWLPPNPLSSYYELWNGGGCARRCDGVTVEVSVKIGNDDYEMQDQPCLCVAAGSMSCKPYTRLQVVLPNVRFGGVWRLESKGWNAAHEMPAMVQMIEQLQARAGLVSVAAIRLEKRQTQGGRKQFVTPTLVIHETPANIVAGELEMRGPALSSAGQAAAALGTSTDDGERADSVDPALVADDDGIVDAEIVVDIYSLPNAPRNEVELTERQVAGLEAGTAKWSATTEGKVVRA